jgi:thiol:disulfide interchange protein DsbD
LVLLATNSFASHVKWTAKLLPEDARAGESAVIAVTGVIDPGWHIYQLKQQNAATPTSFEVPKNDSVTADGEAIQPTPKNVYDPNFKVQVGLFEGAVTFAVPVKLRATDKGSQSLKISVSDQTCNASVCALPETSDVPVSFTVATGPARADHQKPITAVAVQPAGYSGGATSAQPAAEPRTNGTSTDAATNVKQAERQGLLSFIGLAFVSGLLALLTPCVFPMIPITVSYFSKSAADKGKKRNVGGALIYCAGIISTYTVVGVAFTVIFGATGIQKFATNPYVNVAMAALFVVLALSLFGLFEIRMPGSVINKASSESQRGGKWAPFFMGLTFTLTSFTCTASFVGVALADAAEGKLFYPIVGMLAFGAAFSLPFFFLALFPQYLAGLPKSGGWLNTVKGYMAFIELAAAVKFLSNADLSWNLYLLPQPVFLAIWAIIGTLAVLYLCNVVIIGPTSSVKKMGLGRVVFAVATGISTFMFLGGVAGNTDHFGTYLTAFLPPNPYPGHQSAVSAKDIHWESDYQKALAEAKSTHTALFVDFTGVTCTNCRAMEEQVFPVTSVRGLIDHYIPVQLYTDRPTPDDRSNAKLEQDLAHQETLPAYVLVSPDGKAMKVFSGYDPDPAHFQTFLQAGLTAPVAIR